MRYFRVQIGVMLCALMCAPGHADAQLNETLKITAADTAAQDFFGQSVAVSGTTALIGAHFDDDAGVQSGSAYIFDTTTGKQLFKLAASDAAAGDQFGISVAVSGTTALVGAIFDDDGGDNSGSAYLFDTTTGNELFKLTAADAATFDNFGFSVAVSGTTAIIGARLDNDGGTFSGSAYIFDTTTGNQLFKLTAADAAAGDQFGRSVAISGNIAVIGAQRDDDAGGDSGSAYIFDTTTGNELFKITASDAAALDNFGISVALSGTTAIIGAFGDDDAGGFSGSAYGFDNIPEPASVTLLAAGGLAILRRR